MLRDTRKLLRAFAADESGATAIEYSIIAAGIAGVIITVVTTVGNNLTSTFYDKISGAFGALP